MIRKFEIPYNFDPNYIATLKQCGLIDDSIAFVYVAPFYEDYITVLREEPYPFSSLTRDQYITHIHKLKMAFPNKLQLLLQKKDKIMPKEQLQWYINLGFSHFCCGNPEQAKIIKEINPNFTVIGSIVLHATRSEIKDSNSYYKDFFDYFVLDFSYGRNLQKIKYMPDTKKYMILVNAICHRYCDGDHHWNIKSLNDKMICPGKFGVEQNDFNQTVWIRPMDLKYFDPYIDVYKIQDRSWSTAEIIRDIILYTTDYSLWPAIEYNENMYNTYDEK